MLHHKDTLRMASTGELGGLQNIGPKHSRQQWRNVQRCSSFLEHVEGIDFFTLDSHFRSTMHIQNHLHIQFLVCCTKVKVRPKLDTKRKISNFPTPKARSALNYDITWKWMSFTANHYFKVRHDHLTISPVHKITEIASGLSSENGQIIKLYENYRCYCNSEHVFLDSINTNLTSVVAENMRQSTK